MRRAKLYQKLSRESSLSSGVSKSEGRSHYSNEKSSPFCTKSGWFHSLILLVEFASKWIQIDRVTFAIQSDDGVLKRNGRQFQGVARVPLLLAACFKLETGVLRSHTIPNHCVGRD